MSRPVMIIDGLNLFMRYYIAHPAMSTNGEQIGGIVGFLNAISNIGKKVGPEEIYVVWESGGSIKKRSVFKDYKLNRKPKKMNRFYDDIPDTITNRKDQIKILINCLNFTSVRQVYVQNCEADDAIGYMCKYSFKDRRKVIISSDHDFYQLLDNTTIIWSPTLKDFVTKKTVPDRFKVSSHNFCLSKSIAGDKSDNIPGVKGVSFKTIAKYIPETTLNEELTLDEFFKLVEEKNKVKEANACKKILSNETMIRRNWRLVRLDTNNINIDQIKKIETCLCKSKQLNNKIGMLRFLIKIGIDKFNIDNLFFTLKALRR